MSKRTIIVPSASLVVLVVIFVVVSTMRSCGLAPQRYESASAENGGLIKDYDPALATAVAKPEATGGPAQKQ